MKRIVVAIALILVVGLALLGAANGTSESEFCSNFSGEKGVHRLKIITLYQEFVQFQDTSRFRSYGFSRGGYSSWLGQLDRLRDIPRLFINIRSILDRNNMVAEGGGLIFAGDVENLAMDYVFYGGPNMRWTRDLEVALDLAVSILKECGLIE